MSKSDDTQTETTRTDPITERACPFCGQAVSSNQLHRHLPCNEVPDPEPDASAGWREEHVAQGVAPDAHDTTAGGEQR